MRSSTKTHAFIHEFPFHRYFQHGRLEHLLEEQQGGTSELVIDLLAMQPLGPAALIEHEGLPAERVQGTFQPRRIRFTNLAWIRREGLYTRLEEVPFDHPCRNLQGMLVWSPAGKEPFFLMTKQAHDEAVLMFSARGFVEEERSGPTQQVNLIRRWSPPPAMRPGLVPNPPVIRKRFGGDPISLRIGRRVFHKRLFVGSLEEQTEQRPQVDCVLNLGEEPSRWAILGKNTGIQTDRWAVQGEGEAGMSAEGIKSQAGWALERLRTGRSVLVHCVSGINRSVTVAIAILILQEGLSAQAAFERVSQRHPWARPDPGHWLQLKWLAHQTGAHTGRISAGDAHERPRHP